MTKTQFLKLLSSEFNDAICLKGSLHPDKMDEAKAVSKEIKRIVVETFKKIPPSHFPCNTERLDRKVRALEMAGLEIDYED